MFAKVGKAVVPKDTESPQGKSRGHLDADQRAKLDATVVKLFKLHRRLAHKQLCQLLQDCRQTWQPDTLKECIEGLITKEYITRDDEDR